MRFHGHVLHPLGLVRVFVDEVRGREAVSNAAQFGMDLGHHVVMRPGNTGCFPVLLTVNRRGPGEDGLLRRKHRLKKLVLHLQRPGTGLSRAHGLGHHRGNPLPDEPHHVIQHTGVIRVVSVILVLGGGEQQLRSVLMGEDRHDAGNRQCRGLVNGHDAGMRMRRTQELHVQKARKLLSRDIKGVTGGSGDHGVAGGCGNVVAELSGRGGNSGWWLAPRNVSSGVVLVIATVAADRVCDGAVTGAAAQIAFEVAGQVGSLLVVERCSRHHHAGGAESALEPLGLQELFLHRVQFAVLGQTLNGGDRFALGADCRVDAAVDGCAVDVHGAGTAVTAVAALFNAEVALLAEEGAEALSGAGCGLRGRTIDLNCHCGPPSAGCLMWLAGWTAGARCCAGARNRRTRSWTRPAARPGSPRQA